jgi:RNase P subunit RPR2
MKTLKEHNEELLRKDRADVACDKCGEEMYYSNSNIHIQHIMDKTVKVMCHKCNYTGLKIKPPFLSLASDSKSIAESITC